MKLTLLNTPHGLVPMYDADYDERKKLRLGQTYVAEIRVPRNYRFHKLAFALVNAAYACLPEKTQRGSASTSRSLRGITKCTTIRVCANGWRFRNRGLSAVWTRRLSASSTRG